MADNEPLDGETLDPNYRWTTLISGVLGAYSLVCLRCGCLVGHPPAHDNYCKEK